MSNLQLLAEKGGNKRDWGELMEKMDGMGPPLKRVVTRKPSNKLKSPTNVTDDIFNQAPTEFFDPDHHGYRLHRGNLVYKTPDGRVLPATGVDEFGPFKDAPRQYLYMKQASRYGKK